MDISNALNPPTEACSRSYIYYYSEQWLSVSYITFSVPWGSYKVMAVYVLKLAAYGYGWRMTDEWTRLMVIKQHTLIIITSTQVNSSLMCSHVYCWLWFLLKICLKNKVKTLWRLPWELVTATGRLTIVVALQSSCLEGGQGWNIDRVNGRYYFDGYCGLTLQMAR